MILKNIKLTCLICAMLLLFCACGTQQELPPVNGQSGIEQSFSDETAGENEDQLMEAEGQTDFNRISWNEGQALKYADQFEIKRSEDYRLVTIVDGGRFLLVSKDKKIPNNVPEDVAVLKTPIRKAYLSSSSVFDLIRQIGALNCIRLSGQKENSLYIPEAVDAMQRGDMIYAGKYSEPDYELLINEGCDLAIENTMIFHNPETKEKLESLGIPVLIERSSYETHPFGRMEWIKLYGALFDREAEAEKFFNDRVEVLEPILEKEKTGCSVAFFYVNTNGIINVRKPGDYIPKMIELAGGEYALKDALADEENALSTMNMQMEDFYLAAKDADVIIYNGTTTGVLNSISELLQKDELFSDFKAVKEKRVYCTGKNFFQETTAIGDLMEDLSTLMRDPGAESFHQLVKLK